MSDWFYYDSTGTKQGPINDAQLKAMAQSGMITPETTLQTGTGQTGKAGQIRGLFSTAAPVQGGSSAYCTNCGRPVQAQAVACMSCGATPVGHRKFCRQCGVQLNPEQVVCIKCGAAITPAQTIPNGYGTQNYGAPGYGAQNYGAQNYGAQGYGAPNINAADIPNYMVWAILEALFCCLPFGVIAIVYASGANSAKESGNFVLAKQKAHSAKVWIIWGIILGFITIAFSIFVQIAASGGF